MMRKRVKWTALVAASAAGLLLLSGCNGGDEGPFVSAGTMHTCAVQASGKLQCWGSDDNGSVTGPNASTGTFQQVAAGNGFTCAVTPAHAFQCWGKDSNDEVTGPNASTDSFTQVSAADNHVCGLKTDGHLECFGNTSSSMVSGPNASTDTFDQVATAEEFTCGLKTTGRIQCWGFDSGSGAVDGPNASTLTFREISATELTVECNGCPNPTDCYYIYCWVTTQASCGLMTNLRLHCWGDDTDGMVSGPNAATGPWFQISVGEVHTCAIRANGRLRCWGTDDSGSVTGPNASTSTYSQVSAGSDNTCALETNGHVQCWGGDASGKTSGPNASSALYGNAVLQLELLQGMVRDFDVSPAARALLLDRIRYTLAQVNAGHEAEACRALRDVIAAAKKNPGVGKDEGKEIRLASLAVQASLAC
jgi:hypothetical protein